MPASDSREMTGCVPVPLVDRELAAYVDHESVRYRMTVEAMADVDAGRAVPHEDVKAWAVTLS